LKAGETDQPEGDFIVPERSVPGGKGGSAQLGLNALFSLPL